MISQKFKKKKSRSFIKLASTSSIKSFETPQKNEKKITIERFKDRFDMKSKIIYPIQDQLLNIYNFILLELGKSSGSYISYLENDIKHKPYLIEKQISKLIKSQKLFLEQEYFDIIQVIETNEDMNSRFEQN